MNRAKTNWPKIIKRMVTKARREYAVRLKLEKGGRRKVKMTGKKYKFSVIVSGFELLTNCPDFKYNTLREDNRVRQVDFFEVIKKMRNLPEDSIYLGYENRYDIDGLNVFFMTDKKTKEDVK